MQSSRPASSVILIAERDQKVRDLEKHFLEIAGFTVEFVDDGLTALARSADVQPAVVITEILLPKLDGLTLCRRLGEDPSTREIPVIVFSILAAGPRAIEAGAKAFLKKPFVESVFVPAIRHVIAVRSNGKLEHP